MNAMGPPPPDDDDDEEAERRWNFLVALAAVAIIVVIGFLIVWEIARNQKLQECYLTGRHDCAPVDVPDSR